MTQIRNGGGSSGITTITIGTTTITSGTDQCVLFDDNGVVGQDSPFKYNKTTNTLSLTSGFINIPSSGSTTQCFGPSADAQTTRSMAMGDGALCDGFFGASLAVGFQANATDGSTALGRSTLANGLFGFALGPDANVQGDYSIAIGSSASCPDDNTFVVGGPSTTEGIAHSYLGSGITSTSVLSHTIHATGGSGSNVAGGNLTLAGGKGTGNATPGFVKIQTSAAGASGSTLQTLGTKFEADGTGIGFYGVTPIARAVLATGTGATVDNVITALQNLGLVKQS